MEDWYQEYIEMRYREAQKKSIVSEIWSGDDVHKLSFRKKKTVFKCLNQVDSLIWMNGVQGFLLTIQKYTILSLRTKEVDLFFDGVIAFNIVFLTFTGIISDSLVLTVTSVTTILLLVELFMRLISLNLSNVSDSKQSNSLARVPTYSMPWS